jgi:prepilin-type N-terminal cleavage/methylation domain-containing protein
MSKNIRSQAGFTLVELAIVMIIIGLLIGGVLKGQELINNAQITSTVAQVKAMDAAVSTFDDMYSALPGDMLNPGARLATCVAIGAACNTAGDGDRLVDSTFAGAPAGEATTFFVHLSVADLLTGINPAGAAAAWGSLYPEANIAGGFHAGGTQTGAAAQFSTVVAPGTVLNAGTYLALTATAGAAPAPILTPNQAFRIDNKIDDGQPGSGSVRAFGAAACIAGAVYNEASPAQDCGTYIRIQG